MNIKFIFFYSLGIIVAFLLGKQFSSPKLISHTTTSLKNDEIHLKAELTKTNLNILPNKVEVDEQSKNCLPKFITSELTALGINSEQLNKHSWNQFLKKHSFQVINNFTNQFIGKNNLLHLAFSTEFNEEDILSLIKQGYDINALNNEGKTPLDLALSNRLIGLDLIKKNSRRAQWRLNRKFSSLNFTEQKRSG